MPRVRLGGTVVVTGRAEAGGPDWVYVPVDVPPGVRRLTVRCAYDRSAGVLDLGLFDANGHGLGARDGFRGWSGGARSEVTVSAATATPGYLAGPIQPGTWQVVLGPYRVPPEGLDWRVEVRAVGGPAPGGEAPAPSPGPRRRGPAERAPGGAPGWYRGDLHVHTVHSDGEYTPGEVLTGALAAGLDFVASTEHNTSAAHAAWARLRHPGLLVLDGEEVTTRAGHWGAIGLPSGWWVDWRYRPEDGALPGIAREVRAQGALVVANHPSAPVEGAAWRFGYDDVDAVEVWNDRVDELANDEAVAGWDALLRAGGPVVATAGSDAHRPPDAIGSPRTVVWADRLAAREVVAGLRAGRSYLARSARVGVSFTAAAAGREAGMGDRLTGRPGEPVSVRLRVRGAARGVVTLHSQDGPVHDERLATGRAAGVGWEAPLGSLSYLRAEVRRADGDLEVLTNPIWFGPA